MEERKILVTSKILVHFSCNLNIQNCIEITESKKCHRALKSNCSSPTSIRSFHTGGILLCEEEKKKPTQNKTEEVISFKSILFLLWVALWIADGHCCYQCRANIAKNSHCHNIFIFRTANTSRIWQERVQIYMQKSLQDFSGSQFSPLDMLRSPQEEHRGKEKKTSAEFSWYERKANFLRSGTSMMEMSNLSLSWNKN